MTQRVLSVVIIYSEKMDSNYQKKDSFYIECGTSRPWEKKGWLEYKEIMYLSWII